MIPENAWLLRMNVSASRSIGGTPCYLAIVQKARAMGIAGASVFTAEVSMGLDRKIRDVQSEYSSYDQVVTIEIVDSQTQIESLIDALGPLAAGGATIEPVSVIHQGAHAASSRE